MRKPLGKFLWLIFLVVFLILLLTGCGGGGGQPPTPPAPTLSLTISPSQISLYDSATLSWNSKNADSCTASGDWSGSKPLSGSEKVTPTEVGNYTYTLTCSGSGGTTSNSVSLTVVNPVPEITDLSPKAVLSGAKGFTLQVFGKKFVSQSKVRVNGQDRQTEFVSDKELRAEILASDVAQAGTLSITVFNPEPGGLSNTAKLQVIEKGGKIAMAEIADLTIWGDLANEEAGRYVAVAQNLAKPGDSALLISANSSAWIVFVLQNFWGEFLLSEVGSEKLPGIKIDYTGPRIPGGSLFFIRDVGDLNKDGKTDWAVYLNVAIPSSGEVKPGMLFVLPGGEWLESWLGKTIDLADPNLPILKIKGGTENEPWWVGQSFDGGLKFNSDELDDLTVGAPGYQGSRGVVCVVYGKPDFFSPLAQVIDLTQVGSQIPGACITGNLPGKSMGSRHWDLHNLLPDSDGEGRAEWGIGHPSANKVYVLPGQDLFGWYSIGEIGVRFLGFTIDASSNRCSGLNPVTPCNYMFGERVKGGEMENGLALIVISDPDASVRVFNDDAGIVYFFRQMAANGTVLQVSAAQTVLLGAEKTEVAGCSLAVGDLQGNGNQDLAISSPGIEFLRLLFSPLPTGIVELTQVAQVTLITPGTVFREGTTTEIREPWMVIKDVNGDGVKDLIVGVRGNSQMAEKGGVIHISLGGRGIFAP